MSATARRPGLLCKLLVSTGLLALGGCISLSPPLPDPDQLPGSANTVLNPVSFFAQDEYQCGPAALASTLRATGIDVTPEELVGRIYLPERKGSLQTEILATTRSYERLAYVIKPDLESLLSEVAAARPVLVLLNLGVRSWPIWHYAVVVGYDGPAQQLMLHSGTTANQRMDISTFNRRWAWAGQWGMLALRTDELPASADLNAYMTAAASMEAVGKHDAALLAYRTAQQQWPASSWPWLGMANLAYANQDLTGARTAYRQALQLDPANVAARNNFAEALKDSGCFTAARIELEQALQTARGTNLETRITDSLQQLSTSRSDDTAQCQQ